MTSTLGVNAKTNEIYTDGDKGLIYIWSGTIYKVRRVTQTLIQFLVLCFFTKVPFLVIFSFAVNFTLFNTEFWLHGNEDMQCWVKNVLSEKDSGQLIFWWQVGRWNTKARKKRKKVERKLLSTSMTQGLLVGIELWTPVGLNSGHGVLLTKSYLNQNFLYCYPNCETYPANTTEIG